MQTFLSLLKVFIISMIPVLELRASIPMGLSWGLHPAAVIAVSMLGNMVPVAFIIVFIRKIFEWMKKKNGFLESVAEKMEKKAGKHEDTIRKYASLGLLILVAIPLPGTGAWTGSLVAAMFNIRLKHAFPIIFAGVAIAAFIVTGICAGFEAIFR